MPEKRKETGKLCEAWLHFAHPEGASLVWPSWVWVVAGAAGKVASLSWALQETKMIPIILDAMALGVVPWGQSSFSDKVVSDKYWLGETDSQGLMGS